MKFPPVQMRTLAVAVLLLGAAACQDQPEQPVQPAFEPQVLAQSALAELQPVGDSEVSGIVSFMAGVPDSTGIRVIAEFVNLPTGLHGIHIHENGDCSAPDASSAGGHHNPADAPHADRSAAQRHMGDLGNMEADANNLASLDFHDDKLSFEGPGSIIGKAVIVHAAADDLMTQPDGAAGPRIACGIIESRDSRDLLSTEK